jgi:D-3-phosphoglycerate dehydrogenase
MKIVVIGDIVVPRELLVEAAETLEEPGQDTIVPILWPAQTRQEFQSKAQNLEKNGPTAEKVPEEVYREITDADILLTHFCPVPEDLIAAGKQLKLIGTYRFDVCGNSQHRPRPRRS